MKDNIINANRTLHFNAKEYEDLMESILYISNFRHCVSCFSDYLYRCMKKGEDQRNLIVILLAMERVLENLDIAAKVVLDKKPD